MTGVVVESEVTGSSQVVRWLVAVGGFFALFFAVAWCSQRWIQRKWYIAESVQWLAPSVVPHAATMTVVAVLALTIAVPLMRRGLFVAAALTCAGAAIGPLRLVAAPLFAPIGESNEAIADFVWRVGLGFGLLVVMLLVAKWLSGPATAAQPRWAPAMLLLIALPVFALLLWPGARTQEATDDVIALEMAIGWGLLAGGLMAAGLVSRVGTALARALLAAAMATMLWSLYEVGERAVPGWEDGGDEPMFLTAQVSVVLGLCALCGVLLAATGIGRRSAPASNP